jgi:hypothetical protein
MPLFGKLKNFLSFFDHVGWFTDEWNKLISEQVELDVRKLLEELPVDQKKFW